MKKNQKIGYAYASTSEQNLESQLEALKKAGCDQISVDEGTSGAASDREGLAQALSMVGEGDTLVVWRLDRLGRSFDYLKEITDNLGRQGAGFVSLQNGIDTTTPEGKKDFSEWTKEKKPSIAWCEM